MLITRPEATVVTPPFTSEQARRVLEQVCQEVGEQSAGSTLLRFGSNAIFQLAGRSRSVVVRVARDRSRLPVVQRELCVSRWLNGKGGGVPAARVHEAVPDQPLVAAGHPVTFWREVPAGPRPPTTTDLAELLRRFHQHLGSPCALPPFDPTAEVRSRLASGLAIPAADQARIAARCDAIDAAIGSLRPELPPGPVHGDAHTGNLLGQADAAVLNDFEMCATGPREWDLVPLAVAHTRLGLPDERWLAFVDTYGFDVTSWDGYPILREARELGMTTWLAQNVAESRAIADEVARRLDSLRKGEQDRAWIAF